jgi:serine/threonine-protein kinase PpkA
VSAIEIPGYKIIKTLGVGGQATVYLAIQQGFDREVALKVMSPALAADPTFGERFIREAKIVATLSHSKIVTVYDVGESGSFYYLAMEYMRGEELKSRIANGMKAKDALIIIAKLAQALHFAHGKGYIHRDVKSENILFDQDDQPVLTDFGIAKASNSSTQMTQTGKLIGTPEYMSPEQCRGRPLDGRADLYSLGIILYEMLARKVPFTGEDSVSVCIQHVTKPVPKLPARLNHLQWLIDSLLAKDPDNRFQTGKELSEAIQSYLKGAAGQAIKRTGGQSRTVISEVIDKQEEQDHFQEQSFELNDNFDVEQRITVSPEKKSPVVLISIGMLLVISSAIGFVMKEKWLPQAQQALGVNWFADYLIEPVKQNNNTDSPPVETATNAETAKQPENISDAEQIGDSRVNQLIRQAETLAQYAPHELTDIQQAMDLLITAKSLAPDNQNIIQIRDKVVTIALDEAVQAANKKQFDSAEQWVKLVEFADKDNPNLATTKQLVGSVKFAYEQQANDEIEQIKKLSEHIANADKAITEGRLGSPTSNNAIFYLKQAESISADDPRIEQYSARIEARYIQLINQQIDKKEFAKANQYLDKVKSLTSNNVDVALVEKKISSAKGRYDAYRKEQAKKAAIANQKKQAEEKRLAKLADPLVQMRLQSSLQSAGDLVASGNLVQPFGNNALEKYRSVLEIDSTNVDAKAGIKKIEDAIITNLEVALSNQVFGAATEWLEKLRKFNPEDPRIADYQLQLEEIEVNNQISQPTPTSLHDAPVENLQQESTVQEEPLEQVDVLTQHDENAADAEGHPKMEKIVLPEDEIGQSEEDNTQSGQDSEQQKDPDPKI